MGGRSYDDSRYLYALGRPSPWIGDSHEFGWAFFICCGDGEEMKRTSLRPVSKKTKTQRWPRLKALRQHVLARSGYQCECPFRGPWPLYHWGPIDVHHVIKRSHGGTDTPDNAVALCRGHHDMTDWPKAKPGRIGITALGNGAFQWHITDPKGDTP